MKRFLTDQARDALEAAIREVEGVSSAEVVVAVRPRSARYFHVDLLVATAAATLALALLLFSPWPFALGWILVDPILVGLLAAWLTSRWRWLDRTLTFDDVLDEQVRRAAAAAFLERKIHRTRWRTGLLVYVSLLERRAVVVSDLGVQAAVPGDDWDAATGAIDRAVRRGEDGAAVAERIAALGLILGVVLERPDDDINELADSVWTP